jgi:hypothetical protein
MEWSDVLTFAIIAPIIWACLNFRLWTVFRSNRPWRDALRREERK